MHPPLLACRLSLPRRHHNVSFVIAVLLLACWLNNGVALPGQIKTGGGTILGRVVAIETGFPLENVNVYLSQTTRGTSTRGDGTFILSNVPDGVFRCVASRVGYELMSLAVQVSGKDSVRCDFVLRPRTLTLEEIESEGADPSTWKKNLAVFKEEFLGSSEFAEQCEILNPEVLDLRSDPVGTAITASTDSVLLVVNHAFGYRLELRIGSFTWDRTHASGVFHVYPRYVELTPSGDEEQHRWEENRARSYEGSLNHFLVALVGGTVDKELFRIYAVRSPAGIPGNNTRLLSKGEVATMLQSVGPALRWSFPGWLEIDYTGTSTRQASFIRLFEPEAYLAKDGILLSPMCFELRGYWSTFRVATLLPEDWLPPAQ
jgi:hypothetical protein